MTTTRHEPPGRREAASARGLCDTRGLVGRRGSAVLRVAAEDRLGAIWRLALATGLRRGELLSLTWDDISETTVTVRRQVLLPGPYLRETTKSRRARTVRFDNQTHGARHSYATLALEAGVRLDIVSRQLGHASIAITAETYGHPDDKAMEEAARKVGTVLGEGVR